MGPPVVAPPPPQQQCAAAAAPRAALRSGCVAYVEDVAVPGGRAARTDPQLAVAQFLLFRGRVAPSLDDRDVNLVLLVEHEGAAPGALAARAQEIRARLQRERRALPIVHARWVVECIEANRLLPVDGYVL